MALKPDILIIQECESLEKLKYKIEIPPATNALWFGTNPHKGIAIFSFGKTKISVLPDHNEAFKLVIPVAVSAAGYHFNLFAIWAHNPADADGQYIEQVWKAINYYDALLSTQDAILIGDFNSNTIWDKKHRPANHSNVVKYLEAKNIHSTYHNHFKEAQGMERSFTFYLYKHLNKPYHLDYCFASESIMDAIKSVQVGKHAVWSAYSDHMPLIISFKPPKQKQSPPLGAAG